MIYRPSGVVSASYLVMKTFHLFFQYTLRASCLPALTRRQRHSPEQDAGTLYLLGVVLAVVESTRAHFRGDTFKLALRPEQDWTTRRSGGKPSEHSGQ